MDSSPLPVESNPRHSTYNWGGAAQPKVTVLTVMCQQESRSEIQAGTLSTPAQALCLPAVPRCYSQFFVSSNAVSFFACHKKASVVARDGVFAAGLYEPKKTEKETRKRMCRRKGKNMQMPQKCNEAEAESELQPFYCANHYTTREISIVKLN